MPGKEPIIRKAFKEMEILAYRAARYFYRKLKYGFGTDILNVRVPFSNRSIKAIIYPHFREWRIKKSATHSKVPKIPKHDPNEYILFARILGNDVPGISEEEYNLNNLEYILQNEPDFPGVRKLFVINRVVSRLKRKKMVDLLERYNTPYLELAFEAEEFGVIPLCEKVGVGEGVSELGDPSQNLRLDHQLVTRASRSAYLLNNCGARNFALKCGKHSGYEWVLPWDADCFLSAEGFLRVKEGVDHADKRTEHLLVPTPRSEKFSVMPLPCGSMEITSEAQIIVRSSAKSIVDPSEIFKGINRSQGLSSQGGSGLWDAWLYEYEWEMESSCRESSSQSELGGQPDFSSDLGQCGEFSRSKSSAILNFIDDVYDYSKKAAAAKSEIDYLYYRQVKKDRARCPERTLEVNSVFDKVYLVSLAHDLEKRLKVGFQLRALGIDFEWYPAVNGYEGEPLEGYLKYTKRPLGKMSHFVECGDYERMRGSKMIESPGAVGYIHTYISIMQDAKARGFKNILVLEDDIILCHDFKLRFARFMESVDAGWKILHLGASQYVWEGIEIEKVLGDGHYQPELHKTKGSFAIALNESIFDELIDNLSHLDAPFDNFPIGYLYESYRGSCFVAYPYLVMPDVGDSAIREGRSQYLHSNRVGWWVPDFKYPAQKPRVGIVLKSVMSLDSLQRGANRGALYDLNYYFVNENGISPLHSGELLPRDYFVEDIDKQLYASSSLSVDLLLEADPQVTVTGEAIDKAVFEAFAGQPVSGFFTNIACYRNDRVVGRVSVIIPTYKRSEHLQRAVTSVLDQDYEDLEVIVVDDNGADSSFSREAIQIVERCCHRYPHRQLRLIQHVRNANGAAARNSGILASSGEYICFLDDDDIYLPGRISKSVQALDGTNETIGAVYCGFLGWNSPRLNLERFKDGDLTREIFMLDYFKHYLHTNTATYKADAIMAINGFDESYRRHQDLEFNLRFFEGYQVSVVKEALVRLAPEKSAVDNKLYGNDMLVLKRKFFSDFDYLLSEFSDQERFAIYDVHCAEVARYAKGEQQVEQIYDFICGKTRSVGSGRAALID